MVTGAAGQVPRDAELRPLVTSDGPLLREATLLNLNWDSERLDYAQLDEDAHLSRYYDLDFGRGDYGIVASEGREPIGVAWVRYFTAEEPGFGFINPGVPEMCLCVLPGHRGGGVGTTLLEAVLSEGRQRSLTEMSLSVEDGNPARRLYERFGFTPVEPALYEGTMRLVLPSTASPPELSR